MDYAQAHHLRKKSMSKVIQVFSSIGRDKSGQRFYGQLPRHSELDGVRLIDGDKLEVVWSDGSKSKHKVVLQCWWDKAIKNGHTTETFQERATVKIQMDGYQKMVSIEGLYCERIEDG